MSYRPRDDAVQETLSEILASARACGLCDLPHGPRPILRISAASRILIAGQAPGLRVHETGLAFNDRSGDRLRGWLGTTREEFYDESRVAIVPMAFCFPGYDQRGSDRPPPKCCARTWHGRLFAAGPDFQLVVLVGFHAQLYHLGPKAKANLTETVRAWRDYGPRYIPLPHPSWHNIAWLRKNPWFESELLPALRARVRGALEPE